MKEIKVWGTGRKDLWSYGESINIRSDFDEVEICQDNTYLIRKIRELAGTVYVRMQKSSRRRPSVPVSLLAHRKFVAQATDLDQQTARTRSIQRLRSKEQRIRQQEQLITDAIDEIRNQYPRMPIDEAEEIAHRAFAVGSRRVGRTSRLGLSQQVKRAVAAHVRHAHTEYEELLNSNEEKEFARECVAAQIASKLREWSGSPQATHAIESDDNA